MAIIAAQRAIKRGNKHNPDLTKEAKASDNLVSNQGTPNKIKCIGCKTVKSTASFSKNKLALLVAYMKREPAFNAAVDTHITCITCTGGQVTELTCYMCDKTKGLEGFSKTARRTPDKAMCWKCSQEKAEYEPCAEEEEEDEEDSSDDYGDEEDSLASGVGGIYLDGSSSTATYRTGPPSSATGGGVEVTEAAASTTRSVASRSTHKTSGRDKFPKIRAAPPSKSKPKPQEDEDDLLQSDDDSEGTVFRY